MQRRFMRHSQTRYVGRGKPLIVPAKEILQGGKDRLPRFSSIPQLGVTSQLLKLGIGNLLLGLSYFRFFNKIITRRYSICVYLFFIE